MDEQLFPKTQQPNQRVSSVAARLKMAEERYSNLLKRSQMGEESLLQFEKETRAELKALAQKALELKRHIVEINRKVDAMEGELSSVVHKHEFSTVDRYVDMWQPAGFLTREQAKKMIERERNA